MSKSNQKNWLNSLMEKFDSLFEWAGVWAGAWKMAAVAIVLILLTFGISNIVPMGYVGGLLAFVIIGGASLYASGVGRDVR